MDAIHCKKRREEVPLGIYTALADMMPQVEGLLFNGAANTGLRQFGFEGVDLFQLSASIRGFATKLFDQHSRSANCYAPAKILLKRFIRKFLGSDCGAHAQDPVTDLAVLFFPCGGQHPVPFGNLFLPFLVPARVDPSAGAFFYRSVWIEIVRIHCTPAAILRPQIPPDRPPGLNHPGAELGQKGIISGQGSDRGRAKATDTC